MLGLGARIALLLLVGCKQDQAAQDLSAVSADLAGADLVNFPGVKDMAQPTDLAGVDFAGVDFSVSDLSVTMDLSGSDLAGVDLSQRADLAGMTSTVGVNNMVGCGSMSCTFPGFCCVKTSGYACGTGDGVQCGFAGGTPVFCDSAGSTCMSGQVCCLASGAASCSSSCASPGIQVCNPSVSNECVTGTCQKYTGTKLPAGYSTCQ
jgi:hypothetical protein